MWRVNNTNNNNNSNNYIIFHTEASHPLGDLGVARRILLKLIVWKGCEDVYCIVLY
jgi:hypothetical protein